MSYWGLPARPNICITSRGLSSCQLPLAGLYTWVPLIMTVCAGRFTPHAKVAVDTNTYNRQSYWIMLNQYHSFVCTCQDHVIGKFASVTKDVLSICQPNASPMMILTMIVIYDHHEHRQLKPNSDVHLKVMHSQNASDLPARDLQQTSPPPGCGWLCSCQRGEQQSHEVGLSSGWGHCRSLSPSAQHKHRSQVVKRLGFGALHQH